MGDERSSSLPPEGARKRLLLVIAVIAVACVALVAVILSGILNTAGTRDSDTLITKTNAELVIDVSDLTSGWDVTIAYRPDPYQSAPNASEVGVARYTHNISLAPPMVEVVTVNLYHFNSTDAATDAFAQYKAQTSYSYQGNELETVGNDSVGDEAIMCSGNWTGSHAAIKTMVFRENNIIVFLIYEATANVGLSNQAVIEMAEKQDQKLLR